MKYAALRRYLTGQSGDRLRLSFADVERVLGTPLPASAHRRPAWWANDATGHSQARAWLEAGFKTEQVDVERKSVTFARSPNVQQGVREMEQSFDHKPQKVDRHPLIGSMKGTFTIEPGYDLTRPALDPEELAKWDASLERKAELYAKGLRKKP